MMVPERDAERSRTASDGREMADNPTISPHPPRRPTSSDEAAGRSRKRLEAPARERRGDRRLKYARVVVSTSAARRRTSGSQSGRRSASLGPARHNGPQRSAAAGLHQSRAEKCPFVRTELRQRAQRSAGVQSSDRRLGLGYRFRAERRAGRGCHNRGNTRWPRRKQGSLGRFR